MFTESFFANATPEQASLLADIHFKRNDAIECVSELRKMLRRVKTKVNKFEKVIPYLDDNKYGTLRSLMIHNSQLAINKYIIIEKHINYCISMIKAGEGEYKELKSKHTQYAPYLTEKLKRILSFYNYNTHSEAQDQIRIAHGHLKKIDSHLALMRKYNMIPKNWLNSFLQN